MSENTITQANDNIFLDLGFSAEEADNLLIRSQLMLALQNQIKHRGWTLDQTAQHLKQSKEQITALIQGKIGQFSVDTLITMLDRVGMTVKVEICPKVAEVDRLQFNLISQSFSDILRSRRIDTGHGNAASLLPNLRNRVFR
jgi:predicted XRE-type DNA-binding protein